MSEKTGFGLDEMLKQQFHIVMFLWNQKKAVFEDRAAEEEKQRKSQGAGTGMPSMSGLQSMASGMMPGGMSSLMSKAGVGMPSMPH